jgi:hypothetical protein
VSSAPGIALPPREERDGADGGLPNGEEPGVGPASPPQASLGTDDPGRSRSRAWTAGFVAACAYFVLALLAFWPVQPLSSSEAVSCGCYDPVEQMWFLAWTPHAILHGLNPFYTSALNTPFGANLASNTTMPLLGVLASPVTFTFGAVSAYNVLLRLALLSSALSMYLVLRHYRVSPAAAFCGGLVYGFSPYVLDQASLHLNLCFVPLLPLLAVAMDDLVRGGRHSARRAGLQLGALATAQYFISSELLADTGVLALLGLVVLALRYPRAARARAGRVAAGLAWALVPFVLLAGYPIVFGMVGPEHYVRSWQVVNGDETIRNDLLSPIVPTPAELIAPAGWAARAAGFVGGVAENGGYLGIPLACCWLAATVWAALRRNGAALLFGVLAPVAFVLSLGPTLQVAGRGTGRWLPFAVSSHIPLLEIAVAARYSVLVTLCVAVVCAAALDALVGTRAGARAGAGAGAGAGGGAEDDRSTGTGGRAGSSAGGEAIALHGDEDEAGARAGNGDGAGGGSAAIAGMPSGGPESPPDRRLGRPRSAWQGARLVAGGLLAGLCLAAVLPARAIASAPVRVPRYFTSADVRAIPARSTVLVYPYPLLQDDFSMLWQVDSGFRFDLLGGYVFTPLQLHPPSGVGGGGTDAPPTLDPAIVQVLFYAANGSSSWNDATLKVAVPLVGGRPQPQPWLLSQVETFLRKYHVSTVVLDPERFPAPAAPGSPVAHDSMYGPDMFPQAVSSVFVALFGPPVQRDGLLIWYRADTRPLAHPAA